MRISQNNHSGRRDSVRILTILLLAAVSALTLHAGTEVLHPAAWWGMESRDGGVVDRISGAIDVLKGHHRFLDGVTGKALKLDGYTTVLIREPGEAPDPSRGFTVTAWVAVAAYPWNWCAVLSQQEEEASGYALEIGPLGELALRVYSERGREECVFEERLPWKTWVHVAGSWDPVEGMALYVNGRPVARKAGPVPMRPARNSRLMMGSTPVKRKAAYVHRDHGTLPAWFSLDALMDEVKLYTGALVPDDIRKDFALSTPEAPPEIPDRIMPSGPAGPGRFGAYPGRLKFYWEWDELWSVGEYPDVVVRFDRSPARVVFWRGTRYSPAWVSENNLWMADQSVEAWNDKEGCYEHMQDPHCLYSHVRILENTPARVLVHWRYAPVSAYNNLWNVEERSGWACWVDEYYYFFPDQTGIRKVMWRKGSLGEPNQFQESLPLTHPGQLIGEVIEADYVTVANLAGETQLLSYRPDPPRPADRPLPDNLTVQRHNLRSRYKPFIIFEKGSRMHYLRDRSAESLSQAGLSHWPVGQLPCDGRVNDFPDRATHFLSFPVSDPPVHETEDGRLWIASLYGMTDRSMPEILELARSWSQAPEMRRRAGEAEIEGYDMSRRCYILSMMKKNVPGELDLLIEADRDSPVVNLCLKIEGWGEEGCRLWINDENAIPGEDFTTGRIRTSKRTDLLVWIDEKTHQPLHLRLAPTGAENPGE